MENLNSFTKTPSKLGTHGINLISHKGLLMKNEATNGKHGDVFFASTPVNGTNIAIKVQTIRSPYNINDKAYRELRICMELKKLNGTSINFVFLKDWFKIKTTLDTSSRDQIMHLVMDCADSSLSDALKKKTVFSASEVKSILFQLIYSLHIAQQELKFVHNDLHFGNILLSKIPPAIEGAHILYKHESNVWKVEGYLVKICDFGLSRITLPNGTDEEEEVVETEKDAEEVIYNTGNPFSFSFDEGIDMQTIGKQMPRIVNAMDGAPEEKSLLSDLKKKMNRGIPPKNLLSHPFFGSLITTDQLPDSELLVQPIGFTPATSQTFSTNNDNASTNSNNNNPPSESNLTEELEKMTITPSWRKKYRHKRHRSVTSPSKMNPFTPLYKTKPSQEALEEEVPSSEDNKENQEPSMQQLVPTIVVTSPTVALSKRRRQARSFQAEE